MTTANSPAVPNDQKLISVCHGLHANHALHWKQNRTGGHAMQNHELSDTLIDDSSSAEMLNDDAEDITAPLPPPEMQVIRSAAPRAAASIEEEQPREMLSERYQSTKNRLLEEEYAAAVLPFQSATRDDQSPYMQPLSGKISVPALDARVQPSSATKRYGSVVATIGGFLALIAFFFPWFLVLSSCDGEMEVGPVSHLYPLNILYLIIAVASTILSLAVLRHRKAGQPRWAAILHLVLSIIGLLNIPAMSFFMLLIAAVVKAVLIGFWMALVGFVTSLCGSIWMLVDMNRQSRK
jgi:hypothetical protein